jgi:hypothetical protein
MTERIETPKDRKTVVIETYRDRVRACYTDVRSWLGSDHRFRFEQAPSPVADGLGEYAVDRLGVFAGNECVADFRPVAATVLFGAGRIDVFGLVDYAWLHYYTFSPAATTTVRHRDGKVTRSSTPVLDGIDRPGWYWTDLRRDRERLLDRRTLFALFEEISDLECQPDPPLSDGADVVP